MALNMARVVYMGKIYGHCTEVFPEGFDNKTFLPLLP